MDQFGWMIFGLFLGYLLDFTKPYVKTLFTKGNQSWKRKRIDNLLEEYREVAGARGDNWKLSVFSIAYDLMTMVSILLLMVYVIGDTVIRGFHEPVKMGNVNFEIRKDFLDILFVFFSYLWFSSTNRIRKIIDFKKYREKTVNKIKKHGGDPAELDQIDEKLKLKSAL